MANSVASIGCGRPDLLERTRRLVRFRHCHDEYHSEAAISVALSVENAIASSANYTCLVVARTFML